MMYCPQGGATTVSIHGEPQEYYRLKTSHYKATATTEHLNKINWLLGGLVHDGLHNASLGQ